MRSLQMTVLSGRLMAVIIRYIRDVFTFINDDDGDGDGDDDDGGRLMGVIIRYIEVILTIVHDDDDDDDDDFDDHEGDGEDDVCGH